MIKKKNKTFQNLFSNLGCCAGILSFIFSCPTLFFAFIGALQMHLIVGIILRWSYMQEFHLLHFKSLVSPFPFLLSVPLFLFYRPPKPILLTHAVFNNPFVLEFQILYVFLNLYANTKVTPSETEMQDISSILASYPS